MKKMLGKILFWLLLLPLFSLSIVYLILNISDNNISRPMFILLIIVALLLPGFTLAYGFKKTFGWKGWKEIILASFFSALIWTIISIIMNKIFNVNDVGFDGIQSLIFLLAYFIFILIFLQTFKLLLLAKHIIRIGRNK